jgi:hypothetical protein
VQILPPTIHVTGDARRLCVPVIYSFPLQLLYQLHQWIILSAVRHRMSSALTTDELEL